MATALEITNKLIKRMKVLKRFEVQIEMPETFYFNGRIPYDMKVKDGWVTALVYAENYEEAYDKIYNFLN